VVRIMILASVMLIAAYVQASAQTYTVIGQENVFCGRWTQAHTHRDDRSWAMRSWVLGYLSGVNNASPDLVPGDAGAILDWIDNYCRSNPLDPIVDAADALVIELRSREQRRR
jgi:hypothetical protein